MGGVEVELEKMEEGKDSPFCEAGGAGKEGDKTLSLPWNLTRKEGGNAAFLLKSAIQ